jgi:hypothetical protein
MNANGECVGRASCEPCGLRSAERNRYFDGKLLVTADFEDEQRYLRGKDRLHSSFLHGEGTVCGLKLSPHSNPVCRNRYVILEPGLALDCCGHEIVVPDAVQIDLRAEIEEALRERGLFQDGHPEPRDIFVHLAFREYDTAETPSLAGDCGCDDHGTEPGRTRECWQLRVELDPPVATAVDPLAISVNWQHTLATARPRAINVDRARDRLYVAESDQTAGWLRMYDADTHSLLRRVRLRDDGPRPPTALARSLLGDLVYVAQAALGDGARVEIYRQAELETEPAPVQTASLTVPGAVEDLVDLQVSPGDDSLLAITAGGRILRWSSERLRAGAGDPEILTLSGTTLSAVAVTSDGRWAVLTDRTVGDGDLRPGLLVLNLSQFRSLDIDVGLLRAGDGDEEAKAANLLATFDVPHDGAPSPVTPDKLVFSFDDRFLYVISAAAQRLYRIEVRDRLADFVPLPAETNAYRALPLVGQPDAPGAPLPVDVAVSPRDNWVYVLRRLRSEDGSPLDRGEVVVVSVDKLQDAAGIGVFPPESASLVEQATPTEGVAQFQNLAFLGQRLYVAGMQPSADEEPVRGGISILYVDEAECATFFREAVEGCPSCDGAGSVVIASIERYQWDVPIVAPGGEDEDQNTLDNFTHRTLLPSTTRLKQVIDCMLEKGISEGIPGPRGPEGGQGDPGPRGPGITEVTATAAANAAAQLVPIPGDPEGDLRLDLRLPRGPAGARGPGITAVTLTLVDPAQPAAARLEPIPDGSGDFRLVLELPQAGLPPVSPFNQVVNASWHLDEVLTPAQFGELLSRQGVLVSFKQPVAVETLTERSCYVLVRRREKETGLACDCVLPTQAQPVGEADGSGIEVAQRSVTWLVGPTPASPTPANPGTLTEDFELISQASDSKPNQPIAAGVRLRFPEALSNPDAFNRFVEQQGVERLTVVLKGDWILDPVSQALDGNHLWPGIPKRPSGNGVQGDDWVSPIHFRRT